MTRSALLEKIDAAIKQSVSDTLEKLVFMEVTETEEEVEFTSAPLTAVLALHEPYRGEIRVTFPRDLLAKMAETLFWLPEQGVTDRILKDVLAELLNTVAGRFLDSFLPQQQKFRIGLPELAGPDVSTAPSLGRWHFRTGEDHFMVALGQFSPQHQV